MTVKRQAPKNVFSASWLFGHPVVRADKNSRAYWARPNVSPYNQKGGGWMPCLHGRVQTGDDWAALYIPVNELSITMFEKAQWSYYMTSTQTMGANLVIWIHDPEDFDERVEITQRGNVSGLEKAAGWNAHEFNTATTQMLYYGELTTAAGTKTNLTAGTLYTWDQFQADNLFKDWVISRISIEMGWEASGTFDQVWIADLKLNEVPIPLVPREGDLVPIHDLQDTQAAIAITVAPKTPFRLLSLDVHTSEAIAGSALTVTKDAGADGLTNDSYFDTLLFSIAAASVGTSLYKTFEGLEDFSEDDELDIAQSNTGTKNIGCDVCWKPI